ncbi:hypothetical protein BDZ94DRAFT_1247193 [Collybia nuda]|uniref:Uncharacterized protein n=1 Tax=Collybia nuda TaxID=64659 RepID=A0A9P5YG98_9AGAR|nr:hypothetical protein BDZ94DRAFT_1247193 [Collybia nuda]
MLTRFAIFLLSVSLIVFASPISNKRVWDPRDIIARNASEVTSFDEWGGIQSLKNFDSFNGQDNFDGSRNAQIIIVQEQQVVCRRQDARIIQQQLAILQELAKRIITEQICEVETQTIIFSQFHAGLGNFEGELQRKGGRQPGFDGDVARQIQRLVNDDGSINNTDFGFNGTDVGKRTIAPSGSNWDDNTSPESVQRALDAIKSAQNVSHAEPDLGEPKQ